VGIKVWLTTTLTLHTRTAIKVSADFPSPLSPAAATAATGPFRRRHQAGAAPGPPTPPEEGRSTPAAEASRQAYVSRGIDRHTLTHKHTRPLTRAIMSHVHECGDNAPLSSAAAYIV